MSFLCFCSFNLLLVDSFVKDDVFLYNFCPLFFLFLSFSHSLIRLTFLHFATRLTLMILLMRSLEITSFGFNVVFYVFALLEIQKPSRKRERENTKRRNILIKLLQPVYGLDRAINFRRIRVESNST